MAAPRRTWRRQPPQSTSEQQVRAPPRTDRRASPTTLREDNPNPPNSAQIGKSGRAHFSWVSSVGVGWLKRPNSPHNQKGRRVESGLRNHPMLPRSRKFQVPAPHLPIRKPAQDAPEVSRVRRGLLALLKVEWLVRAD